MDVVSCQKTSDMLGGKTCAGGFESGRRNTRRSSEIETERGSGGRLRHEIDAAFAADIGDLVRIAQGGYTAVPYRFLRKLPGSEHGALDMQVGVDEAGQNIYVVDLFGGFIRVVRSPDIADPVVLDRQYAVVKDAVGQVGYVS